ncbi:hypothetical protein N0V82_003415 [Gnomoniopsis sp. IMI 355080]|nr:hypothetical protein N0V82_003415 [Gnomoniopsis sp. IMI 355080]
MTINVPAVATGAFLGVLCLVAAISCVPPITRFLGDLFCCPWRVPFTKKKRRNADEEVGKDELPYVVEPRPDTPVDDRGYHSMSEAYMSAVDVVDPELAKEERRRSAERRSAEYRRSHGLPTDYYQHPNDSSYYHREYSPPREYHHEHHYGTHLDVSPPQVPPHGRDRSRGASRERLYQHQHQHYSPEQEHGFPTQHHAHNNNMSDQYPSEGYSPEHYPSQDYATVQRPQPSHAYSPEERGLAAGYFPNNAYDRRDYEGHYPSTERLVEPRQYSPPRA